MSLGGILAELNLTARICQHR